MVFLVVMDVIFRVNFDEYIIFNSWFSIDVGVRMINIFNNDIIGLNVIEVFFFKFGVFIIIDDILEFKWKKF